MELTQLVVDFYNAVHDWDRAEMTVGKAQQLLLAPETGASGAVVLRSVSGEDEGKKPILAFAISYTAERTEDPADVLLGGTLSWTRSRPAPPCGRCSPWWRPATR